MKKNLVKVTVAAALQAAVALPLAAQQGELTPMRAVQVNSIEGSRSAANGYLKFTTMAPVAGCEAGFWARVSDANYSAYLARVNEALSSKAPVMVVADRAQLWPDSTDKACRIVQLR
jgi:hypothetical protein